MTIISEKYHMIRLRFTPELKVILLERIFAQITAEIWQQNDFVLLLLFRETS